MLNLFDGFILLSLVILLLSLSIITNRARLVKRFGFRLVKEKDYVRSPDYVVKTDRKVVIDAIGAVWFVPKILEEPRPSLREQYQIWKENVNTVDDLFNRRQQFVSKPVVSLDRPYRIWIDDSEEAA